MRIVPLLLLILGAGAQAQPAGLPGTPTPQPYAQPQVHGLPIAPRSHAPLLVNPSQPHSPLSIQPPPARDQPLPALETERRSRQRHPAEAIGKP